VLVDGLSGGQSRTIGSMNEVSPPVDAVLEFKVQSSQVSAEYGHTRSAIVNFTIKSGTNELHGSGFEKGSRALRRGRRKPQDSGRLTPASAARWLRRCANSLNTAP
jgi:hypothetical protein